MLFPTNLSISPKFAFTPMNLIKFCQVGVYTQRCRGTAFIPKDASSAITGTAHGNTQGTKDENEFREIMPTILVAT
jgi:hypothetical protein